MKALSIREPWASLIVRGFKPVENRTWNTYYRGPLLIHAAKTFDVEGFAWVSDNREALGVPFDWESWTMPLGGIIGVANLWNVSMRTEQAHYWPAAATEQELRWFFGPRGFWLRDAKVLPFTPCRGSLGLFETGFVP